MTMKLASSPGEERFDHHARRRLPRRGDLAQRQHRIDGRVRLSHGHRHHHALARGEPVRLDDDRRVALVDVGMRLGRIRERTVVRGRNAVTRHERLGEILGALELRRRACRAEDLEPRHAEPVDDTFGEGRFGADDGQSDALALCERDEARD